MTGLHLVIDIFGSFTLALFAFSLVWIGWVEFRDRVIAPRRSRYVPRQWVDEVRRSGRQSRGGER